MPKENQILKVTIVNGKQICEIQLPYVFVAFPVTKQGISQLLEDLDTAIQQIVEEEESVNVK